MALIGKIRENTVFVLIFIGLGIVLFILMDIMQSGGGVGAGSLKMGEIGGEEINRQEFEQTLSAVYSGGDAYQNRDNLWQFYVNEAMVHQEANKSGLGISETELRDLEFGPSPSPVIRRNFGNPQTGQINRELLNNIQNYIDNDDIEQGIQDRQLSPNFIPIWRYQRREIIAQRLQEKFNALVGKGMYAPSWLAQENADDQVRTLSLALVKVPFDEADEVDVKDADISNYLNENRASYTNDEETRVVSYLSFEVTPTAKDSAEIRQELEDAKTEWQSTTIGDSLFATTNNGSFANTFYGERALGDGALADSLLNSMEVGAIYGPYVEGTAYKLAKLVDREVVADSANTRHILISASTPEQFETAEATVDSLMGVIRRGGSWDELAEEFSQDPGSKDNGGLYEGVTPGQFVKPYDDIIFRTGNLRQLYSVRSQFGMHLVEVLKRSSTSSPRVKVAYVQEDIVPSSDTENTVLERAQLFLADNQNLEALQAAAANDPNLTVRQSAPLTVNSYRIPELGNNGGEIRDIACWAFSADVGDTDGRVYTFTDPQLYYENRHVIIALSSIVPKGLAPVASVRDDLTPVVANQLKGEQLRSSIAGKDLLAVAQQFNVEVDTVNNVNLTMVNLPGLGREPKVIAAAFRTGAQQVSSPIVGETGVYIVKPLNEINTTTSGSLPTARQSIQSRNRSQVTSQLLNSMRSGVELDDRRASLECQ